MMRGVGNQTRQEIIDFLSKLRERFPSVEAVHPKDQPATEEIVGPLGLELLHHRIVGARNPKKDAEWRIRAALLGVTASDSQPPSLWPSQTDVADSLGITRARVGQVVTADRSAGAKIPSSLRSATSCASRFSASGVWSRSPKSST